MASPQKIINAHAYAVICSVLVSLHGFILIPIIIKSVGANVYGSYILLASIVNIAFGVSSLGTEIRVIKYLPTVSTREQRTNIYYPQLILQGAIILLIAISIALYGNSFAFLQSNALILYFPYILACYLIAYFLYSQTLIYYRYTSRINYMAIMAVAFPYLHIGLILIINKISIVSVNSLFISQGISAVIVVAPFWAIIFKETQVRSLKMSVNRLWEDLKNGFPLVLNIVTDFILVIADRYIIALFLDIEMVAVYDVSYKIGAIVTMVSKAINLTLPQLLTKVYIENASERANRLLLIFIKWFLYIAVPFFLTTLIYGKDILFVFTNLRIASAGYKIIPIVSVGCIFYGINVLLSCVFIVKLQTKILFMSNLLAGVTNILVNVLLISIFKNILVCAVTTLLSYVLAFWYLAKHLDLQISLRSEKIYLVKTSVIVIAYGIYLIIMKFGFGIKMVNLFSLISVLAGGVAIYISLSLLIKIVTHDEIEIIIK